ncbi:BMP family ABC transporter substrate-binding protein [Litorilinea aerophila]|uniref:BMP family ABC transporter substrate-binding protein n=1 Tax=Litorilinea aerophila TaxID=1204385 RepID=A0A540VHF4_9CHLR|nr:BMP family ABC transporter substrate-binding protein [Litorilinea aerophila]MCC9076233.1 BMP family ABC transporter substrate-binding protein [Litorilinea aerophila]GIV79979.1 MAG: BMP family ABC transporter substrate-binding protein [Litorilinea sp.]
MRNKRAWFLLTVMMVAALLLSACPAATPAPGGAPAAGEETSAATEAAPEAPAADAGGVQIPDIEEGKFNVAFVYVGPIGDGGWTYAHNQGRLYLEEQLGDQVHTAYLESVPEGADAVRVIRSLARKGFNAIFTTSFGYMDPTEEVAAEFPDIYFVHISGFKKNDTNFANLFGAMEDMKYLAGMIAGARAKADGSNRVGYIAPFPIAEVIRLGNALALGMRRTCPECEMDIRWIFTWFDPDKEREAAISLLDAGATVVVTGADTPGPVQAAGERGLYGIGYDSDNACEVDPEHCLTVPYWHWGPAYAQLVQQMMDGTFVPDDYYFDADTGIVGLLGFMEGQEPMPAVPEEVIPEVRELLAQMLAGEFDRFDIFTGPIYDNKGNLVVPEGQQLTQSDLEGIDAELGAMLGREGCTICMNWLAEGFVPDAEIPQN